MKNLHKNIFLFVFSFMFLLKFSSFGISLNTNESKKYYKSSKQMIVILTGSWDDIHGTLQRYERKNGGVWTKVGDRIKVVLGKKGTAWGVGLNINPKKEKVKKEKDEKTPAGIFKITRVFFKNSEFVNDCRMEHTLINKYTVAVDDPKSKYYNTIVDLRKVRKNKRDWDHHKTIKNEDLYNVGIVIDHNYPVRKNSIAGSNIYMHKFKNSHQGTLGGVGLAKDNLEEILFWLNKANNPIIAIMPIQKYKSCPKSILKDLPTAFELISIK